jgi:signal peptidase
MNRTLNILGNLVFAMVLLMVLGAFLANHFLDITFHTIVSESMTPLINVGDVVALNKRVKAEDIKVGDIIAFRAPGVDIPVTHRVIVASDVEGEITFRTQGDALEEADPWTLSPEQLLGRIIFHIPKLGHLTKLLRTKYGFGLLMVIPAFMILVLEARELVYQKPTPFQSANGLQQPDRTPAYFWLFACLVMTGIVGWVLVGHVESKMLGTFNRLDRKPDKFVFRRVIRNDGPFPLVICLSSEDEDVTFSPSYFRLSPGAEKPVEMTGSSEGGIVTTVGFPPVAPAGFLHRLSTWNPQVAVILASLVPGLILAALGFTVLGGFSSQRAYRRKRARAVHRLRRS